MLVDAHVHAFSAAFLDALAAEAMRQGTVVKIAAVLQQAGIEAPPAAPLALADRWLAEFDKHNVQRAVLIASHPAERDSVAAMLRAHPSRLRGLCMFSPHGAVEGAIHEIAKAGYSGILLFPSLHHYHLADLPWILDAAQQARLHVVVHCGMLNVPLRAAFGLRDETDIRFANPVHLIRAAKAFPQVRMIIPHFGGGFLRECMMLGKACENVLVDTSSSNGWLVAAGSTLHDAFFRAINCFGYERILFGTDSGHWPRGWRKQICDIQQATLRGLDASDDEVGMVFGGNAAQLYWP